MFPPGKYAKSISRNADYVIALENLRDQLGVRNLLLQAFPTYWQDVMEVHQKWLNDPDHVTVVDEELSPAINYWIALTTPNGAPANPMFVHRALLDCDVETMANRVHYFYCSFLEIYEDPDLLANITDWFTMHGPVLLDH